MVDAALLGTLGFAVSAGLATFFAPCAYPLLPGYVGFYLSRDDAGLAGAFARGAAATVGALVVVGVVSAVLLGAGQALVSDLLYLEPLVGVLLVALGGLVVAGRAPEVRVLLPERRRSVSGFALFGAVYALAAAGCVVPVVVGVVVQALALPTEQAALVLGSYALSVALPLAGVTLVAATGSDILREASARAGDVQRVAGGVMILAGAWQIVRSLAYVGVL